MYNGADTAFFLGIGRVITIKSEASEFFIKCSRKRRYRFVFSFTANSSLSEIVTAKAVSEKKSIQIIFVFRYNVEILTILIFVEAVSICKITNDIFKILVCRILCFFRYVRY